MPIYLIHNRILSLVRTISPKLVFVRKSANYHRVRGTLSNKKAWRDSDAWRADPQKLMGQHLNDDDNEHDHDTSPSPFIPPPPSCPCSAPRSSTSAASSTSRSSATTPSGRSSPSTRPRGTSRHPASLVPPAIVRWMDSADNCAP